MTLINNERWKHLLYLNETEVPKVVDMQALGHTEEVSSQTRKEHSKGEEKT